MGSAGPLPVRPGVRVPADELHLEYARSGGPGGQRVNKVETKVILRFSVEGSRALDERQKARLRTALGPRLTAAGEVVVRADRFRDRARNLEDARTRMASLLAAALLPPKPRVPTRPSRGSVARRLESKRRRSIRKRERGDGGE